MVISEHSTRLKLSSLVLCNSSHPKNPHIQTDKDEIEQLLLLYMGIYPILQYRMYWSNHTPFPQITKALKCGVNRFEELRRFLHFNDMDNAPAADL